MSINEQTLDEAYFDWLLTQVRVQHSAFTYRDLCLALYRKKFIWIVPNDDNRVQDGMDLMVDFLREHGLDSTLIGYNEDHCSFLEVIIGLSRRLAFVGGGDPVERAWELICNIGLQSMRDPLSRYKLEKVDHILDRVMWREYDRNGNGGFFPLNFTELDQRKIELWYQLNAYVEENVDVHE